MILNLNLQWESPTHPFGKYRSYSAAWAPSIERRRVNQIGSKKKKRKDQEEKISPINDTYWNASYHESSHQTCSIAPKALPINLVGPGLMCLVTLLPISRAKSHRPCRWIKVIRSSAAAQSARSKADADLWLAISISPWLKNAQQLLKSVCKSIALPLLPSEKTSQVTWKDMTCAYGK